MSRRQRFTHGGRIDSRDRDGRTYMDEPAEPVASIDYDKACDERSYGEDDTAQRARDAALAAPLTDAGYQQIERVAAYLDRTGRTCDASGTPTDTRNGIRKDRQTEDALHLLWSLPGYGAAADRAMIQVFESDTPDA